MYMQTPVTAIPWFERNDYETFRKVLPDRDWHDTYDDWLRDAQQLIERIQSHDLIVFKAHVCSDVFVKWCKDTGHRVENASLAQFGSDYARRAYEDRERD